MREGTSGFWTTQKDGKITIEYVDFEVSEFGGRDFEKTYCLDKENAEKFVAELQKQYEGTLDEMIENNRIFRQLSIPETPALGGDIDDLCDV